jgi:hypothetical protein
MPKKNIIEILAVTFHNRRVPVYFPKRYRRLVCQTTGEISKGCKILVRCTVKNQTVENLLDRLFANGYRNVFIVTRGSADDDVDRASGVEAGGEQPAGVATG